MSNAAPKIEAKPRTCYTLLKLLALKPGQRLVYYVGHLPHDILTSESSARQCPPALKYAAMLRELTGAVYQQAAKGRVKLVEEDTVRVIDRVRPSDGVLVTLKVEVKEYSVVGR